MDRPLIVLDTETANARGAPHMIELGAVRVVDGEIEDTFEELVCPRVPIEQEAGEVHGITDRDVRSAPEAPEVLARFSDWAGADWLAAHNAGADTRVLGFEYLRAGLEPPPGPFVDSLALAKRYLPEAPDHQLHTLVEHLDLEDGDRHRALADAVWCWKVIEECLERAGGLASARLVDLVAAGAPLTIATRRPPEPRMSPRLRPLEPAIEDERIVTILYGSQAEAPAPIEVLPRLLFERHKKGYMEAECQSSGLLKTYLLERVKKVL